MAVLGGSYGPPLEDGGMASGRPEPLPRLHMHAQTPISQVLIEIWSGRTPTSDRQQQRAQQPHGAGARAEGVLRGEQPQQCAERPLRRLQLQERRDRRGTARDTSAAAHLQADQHRRHEKLGARSSSFDVSFETESSDMMDEPILSKTARKKLKLRAGELVSKVNQQRLLLGSNKLTPSTRSYALRTQWNVAFAPPAPAALRARHVAPGGT